jgi:gas vesicle protein
MFNLQTHLMRRAGSGSVTPLQTAPATQFKRSVHWYELSKDTQEAWRKEIAQKVIDQLNTIYGLNPRTASLTSNEKTDLAEKLLKEIKGDIVDAVKRNDPRTAITLLEQWL